MLEDGAWQETFFFCTGENTLSVSWEAGWVYLHAGAFTTDDDYDSLTDPSHGIAQM